MMDGVPGNDYDMAMHGGEAQDDEELNMSGQFSPPHEPEANNRFNAMDHDHELHDDKAAK